MLRGIALDGINKQEYDARTTFEIRAFFYDDY